MQQGPVQEPVQDLEQESVQEDREQQGTVQDMHILQRDPMAQDTGADEMQDFSQAHEQLTYS